MLIVDEHAAVSDDDLTPGSAQAAAGVVDVAADSQLRRRLRVHLRCARGVPESARTADADCGASELGRRAASRRRGRAHRRRRRSGCRFPRTLRLRGGVADYRRVNPFYDLSDQRLEARVRAEQGIASGCGSAPPHARRASRSAASAIGMTPPGVDVTVDTRLDPSFPRNAVYAATGVERLTFAGGSARRATTDLRGYHRHRPDGTRCSECLRHHESGAAPVRAAAPRRRRHARARRDGDVAGGGAGSRLRRRSSRGRQRGVGLAWNCGLPLNSPIDVGRFGVETFVDWGTTWASGGRLQDESVGPRHRRRHLLRRGPADRHARRRLAAGRECARELRVRRQFRTPAQGARAEPTGRAVRPPARPPCRPAWSRRRSCGP